MKIFSWFDTRLKSKYIHTYEQKYGKDYVFVITRSKLYFYYKVILRIVYGMATHIGFMAAIYYLWGKDIAVTYWFWIGLVFALILYLIALENYIDYTMNYAIFTPDEAILVEQIWLFHRNIKSLDIKKIKSISTKKSSIFFSIFNDGLLTILSEGNEHVWEHLWDIRFKYVHNPEQAKSQIHEIILHSSNQ